AEENNLLVMEDAAQGLGVFNAACIAPMNVQHVGTFGDAGIIAFFADKNIIMGEGGVVLTNNESTYNKLLYLRNQGRLSSGRFVHEQLGMNFKITDMQCAVGFAQMERLDKITRRRSMVYNWYRKYLADEIADDSVKLMDVPKSNHIPLRCPILVKNRKAVQEYLENHGIQTREMSLPLHRNPCWKHLGYKESDFPNTNMVYESGILLPIHTKLTTFDVEFVCAKIKEAIKKLDMNGYCLAHPVS
ncbi:unnamed protein product, partial [marine sediment metagenome]